MLLEKKIRRYKVMNAHRNLVRQGKFLEAKEVLRLLRNGRVVLGLDDVSWEVERICEELGCRINYSHRWYTAIVVL